MDVETGFQSINRAVNDQWIESVDCDLRMIVVNPLSVAARLASFSQKQRDAAIYCRSSLGGSTGPANDRGRISADILQHRKGT